jgi:hypothetical protein
MCETLCRKLNSCVAIAVSPFGINYKGITRASHVFKSQTDGYCLRPLQLPKQKEAARLVCN